MNIDIHDAQANMAFIRSQAAHIEAGVYATRYPTVQYPELIPVDYSAPEFAQSVIYSSTDARGLAKWINGNAKDIPNVATSRSETSTGVHTAGIGYDFGWEEIGLARMMGIALTADRADSARRISEEFVDYVALSTGDADKGFQPFINNSGITPANVANNAGATSRLWTAKTSLEVLKDLNEIITDVWSDSLQIEMADTLLLSPDRLAYIATTPMSADSAMTILDYFLKSNLYTMQTGKKITVRAVRGLETVGVSTTQRMVAYRRAPDVVKLHIPMSHRFLEVQQEGLYYNVPGVMRLGGVDIRLPGAVRYRDAF